MKHDFNTVHLLRSIRLIPSDQLNSQEKLILYTLLSCANEGNDSWNGHEKLVKLTGLGLTSIKKYTKSLDQKGFINITRPEKYYRKESNHYSLDVDKIMTYFIPNKESPDVPLHHERGRHATKKGSPDDCGRGRQTTTKKQREVTKEEGATLASDEAARLKEIEACKARRAEDAIKGVPMPEYVKELILKLRAERSFNEILKH